MLYTTSLCEKSESVLLPLLPDSNVLTIVGPVIHFLFLYWNWSKLRKTWLSITLEPIINSMRFKAPSPSYWTVLRNRKRIKKQPNKIYGPTLFTWHNSVWHKMKKGYMIVNCVLSNETFCFSFRTSLGYTSTVRYFLESSATALYIYIHFMVYTLYWIRPIIISASLISL